MTVCSDCGGTVIEYDAAAGNGFCVKCGTVVEENTIVSEVTFGETSSGAAMVQGSYVAQGSTHARMNGPFGTRGSFDSREQTIANATRKIQNIAAVLRLSEVVCLAATRLYTLAVEHRFTKGRRSLNVVAVCLYVACRQKETRNYMLIDFSDLLQVNVFELGHTYLQLVQTLNLRLPLVDPSHYISRFSALLEFGDDTHKVAHDAVRLVQRFDRDWMTRGRRPAGICGAALLLAARMNNFRRSMEEVVQVVKIADTTLKKRLEEFRRTNSAELTVVDFRRVWLEEEMDPPAFTKGRLDEEKEDGGDDPGAKKGAKRKGSWKETRKRKRGSEDEVNEETIEGLHSALSEQISAHPQGHPHGLPQRPPIDPTLFNQGILAGTIEPAPPFSPDGVEDTLSENIDPALIAQPPTTALDETADIILTEEVSTFLQNPQGTQVSQALGEAEERRLAQMREHVVDELTGLDEEELDRMLLSDQEVRIKERVWVEINRDYLEAIAAKAEREDLGVAQPKNRKRRKTNSKPRDASNPSGSTAAEAVKNLIKKNPRYSKRINYEALKELFVESSPVITHSFQNETKMEEILPETGDMVLLEEEEGGGVGVLNNNKQVLAAPEADEDAEGEEDLGDGFGAGAGEWDDFYEQEV